MLRLISKLLDRLRGKRRDDTEYLRSSKANKARLNAAIEELKAGRGTHTNITKVRVAARKSAPAEPSGG